MAGLITISIIATILWILELACLMRMSDEDFPGRFDKPLWVAIMIFTFVLGALAFGVWKVSVAASRHVEATARRRSVLRNAGKADESG